jgi:hypothetical protein
MIVGCGLIVPLPVSVNFYPIDGPYAQQNPVPVFAATGWLQAGSVGITLRFPNGESIHVDIADSITGTRAANDDMAPIWDRVFGPGFYTARVLGAPGHARGTAIGSMGTQLDVESLGDSGVARDSRGNIFKWGT